MITLLHANMHARCNTDVYVCSVPVECHEPLTKLATRKGPRVFYNTR